MICLNLRSKSINDECNYTELIKDYDNNIGIHNCKGGDFQITCVLSTKSKIHCYLQMLKNYKKSEENS